MKPRLQSLARRYQPLLGWTWLLRWYSFIFIVGFLSGLLTGCAGLTELATPVMPSTPSPTADYSTQEILFPTPTQQVDLPTLPRLRIWIPAQFDPDSGSQADEILSQRLDEFIVEHPGVEIQVRIKALSGPGGMLDSLSASSAAAHLAMPDVVALPRELLEVAALKGLLRSVNDLTDELNVPDWYDYAIQLSFLQDSAFGLPFAGDALILVYRPKKIPFPPVDWSAALSMRQSLIFPAADPLALFTVSQYQAGGGEIRDQEGRPFLAPEQLNVVLDFYWKAEQTGLMPYWLTQFQSDEQAWQAFLEERSDMVVTWSSRYLSMLSSNEDASLDFAIAPLPTPDGQPFTLATGWIWALASPQQDKRILSMELIEFLSEANFLARWTEALGYLPPRSKALNNWTKLEIQPLLNDIARSAELYPSTDISTPLGFSLQQAVIGVLKKQYEPAAAAQQAADELSGP